MEMMGLNISTEVTGHFLSPQRTSTGDVISTQERPQAAKDNYILKNDRRRCLGN